MSLQNGILEASGFDFGGFGPLFWKPRASILELRGFIFEGLAVPALILEGLGIFDGFRRHPWNHIRRFWVYIVVA